MSIQTLSLLHLADAHMLHNQGPQLKLMFMHPTAVIKSNNCSWGKLHGNEISSGIRPADLGVRVALLCWILLQNVIYYILVILKLRILLPEDATCVFLAAVL